MKQRIKENFTKYKKNFPYVIMASVLTSVAVIGFVYVVAGLAV